MLGEQGVTDDVQGMLEQDDGRELWSGLDVRDRGRGRRYEGRGAAPSAQGGLLRQRLDGGVRAPVRGAGLGSSAGTLGGDVLSVAGAVDVDADGMHGEAVEDGSGDGGVAEVAAPLAQIDVGGDGRGEPSVSSVDEVEEGVRRGGLVVVLADLAEADVVDDQQVGASPGLESHRIGVVCKSGVQVGEQVGAASEAERDALDAGAKAEGLENVALAGAALAGDDEVVVTADEVETCQLEDEGLIEGGLEVEVEGLERLVLDETAVANAPRDARLGLVVDLGGEDVLEPRAVTGPLTSGPSQQLVEGAEGVGEAEVGEMPAEAIDEDARVIARSGCDRCERQRCGVRRRSLGRRGLGHREAPSESRCGWRAGGRRIRRGHAAW